MQGKQLKNVYKKFIIFFEKPIDKRLKIWYNNIVNRDKTKQD